MTSREDLFASRLLAGKRAIITGGGTGIGEAISHGFVREGARIVIAGMTREAAEATAAELDDGMGRATAFVGDLSDPAAVDACAAFARETLGGVDILVNNASVFGAVARIEDFPIEAFDATFRYNVRSAFLISRALLPDLQATRGTILFSGSGVGICGSPMVAPYAASKGAFHALALSLAAEQARHGVRVNAVAIGITETAWNNDDKGGAPADPQKPTLPFNRLGAAMEVAEVFVFLACDRASYITGAIWQADGGFLIGHGMIGQDVPADVATAPEWSAPHARTYAGLDDLWWKPEGA